MYQQQHFGTYPQGAYQPPTAPAPGAQGPAPGQGQGQAPYAGAGPQVGYPVYGYPGHADGYGYGAGQFQAVQGPAGYYPPAYPGAADPRYQAQTPFFNFGNDRFIKGLVIGAAAAYLLTNESVQRGAIKGLVKVWSALQGGVAEIKERFHDAEAEIRAAESDPGV